MLGKHPNIVECLGFATDPTGKEAPALVLEQAFRYAAFVSEHEALFVRSSESLLVLFVSVLLVDCLPVQRITGVAPDPIRAPKPILCPVRVIHRSRPNREVIKLIGSADSDSKSTHLDD